MQINININSTDHVSRTALFHGISISQTEVVEVLLANPHLELNVPDIHNRTTLYWACGAGLSNMVRLLLAEKRTDCNSIATDLAPLEVAALNGRAETVPVLLELNDIDVNKRWPLYSAVNSKAEEVVKLLLDDERIDANGGPKGDTPLGLANRGRCVPIIQLLLGMRDVLVNITTGNGKIPLRVFGGLGRNLGGTILFRLAYILF